MKKKGPCDYNIWVQCDSSDCSTCGWNPSVKEHRLDTIRKTNPRTSGKRVTKQVEVFDETTRKTVGRIAWPVLGCMEDKYW